MSDYYGYDPYQTLAQDIYSQGQANNYSHQLGFINAEEMYANRQAQSDYSYGAARLGLQSQGIGLDRQQLGLDRTYENARYGLSMQDLGISAGGYQRDIGTENAMHGLRQQGFGLDRSELDLAEQRIGTGERESQFDAWGRRRDQMSQATAGGAVTTAANREQMGRIATMLAFAMERAREDRAGVGINRERVNLAESGEGVQHQSTLGHLNDALAHLSVQGGLLGAEHTHALGGFGVQEGRLGLAEQGVGLEQGHLSEQLQLAREGNALRASENRYNLGQSFLGY